MTSIGDHQKRPCYPSHFKKLKTLRSSFFIWHWAHLGLYIPYTYPISYSSHLHKTSHCLPIPIFSALAWIIFFHLFILRPDSLLRTLLPVISPAVAIFSPTPVGAIGYKVDSLFSIHSLKILITWFTVSKFSLVIMTDDICISTHVQANRLLQWRECSISALMW